MVTVKCPCWMFFIGIVAIKNIPAALSRDISCRSAYIYVYMRIHTHTLYVYIYKCALHGERQTFLYWMTKYIITVRFPEKHNGSLSESACSSLWEHVLETPVGNWEARFGRGYSPTEKSLIMASQNCPKSNCPESRRKGF